MNKERQTGISTKTDSTYYEIQFVRKEKDKYRLMRNFSSFLVAATGVAVLSDILQNNLNSSYTEINRCVFTASLAICSACTLITRLKSPAEKELHKMKSWIKQAHKEGQLLDVNSNDEVQICDLIDASKRVGHNIDRSK